MEPADDKMQAFLYRHLVPAQEFCVFVQKAQWPTLSIKRDASDPVQLPAGGSVQVRLKTPRRPTLNGIGLELYNPPAGITLHDVSITQGELAFVLKADRETVKCPFSSNLIIQVFREFTPPQKKGKPAPKKQRKPLGFLPAIGIQIISESGSNMGDN